MENATKALLIAAAVLVAIVLIALGVRLLSAATNTSQEASEVSEGIKTQTEGAATEATEPLSGLGFGTESGAGG